MLLKATLKTHGPGSVLKEKHVLAMVFVSPLFPPPPLSHLIHAPVLELMTHFCPMQTVVFEDVPINIVVAALSSSTAPTSPTESLSPMCRPDWSCGEERFPGTSEAVKSPKESNGRVSHELKHS